MIGRHPPASASLTVIAALWFSSPAMAQTVPAEEGQTPSWSGSDIVVTGVRDGYSAPETSAATRTDTPLIQVPQSVQVLTRTSIRARRSWVRSEPARHHERPLVRGVRLVDAGPGPHEANA